MQKQETAWRFEATIKSTINLLTQFAYVIIYLTQTHINTHLKRIFLPLNNIFYLPSHTDGVYGALRVTWDAKRGRDYVALAGGKVWWVLCIDDDAAQPGLSWSRCVLTFVSQPDYTVAPSRATGINKAEADKHYRGGGLDFLQLTSGLVKSSVIIGSLAVFLDLL